MLKKLTAYDLKVIAILAMLLDHLAHIVVCLPIEPSLRTVIAVIMNSIGRITMPIMCFFIAEGYHHTKDIRKYLLRLFVFALISQIPYYIFGMSAVPQSIAEFVNASFGRLNVIHTLLMGLVALTIVKSDRLNFVLKLIGAGCALYLTKHSDWGYFGVLWVLIFGLFRGNIKAQMIAFALTSILRCSLNYTNNAMSFFMQLCTVLAIPLLCMYNGQLGKKNKYGFYIFYPLHLLILGIIRLIIT